MIAVDTSVVVAGFASWHEGHASAASVLSRRPRLPAHVLIESYSVLTRLPAPHRADGGIVEALDELESDPDAGAALEEVFARIRRARCSGGSSSGRGVKLEARRRLEDIFEYVAADNLRAAG